MPRNNEFQYYSLAKEGLLHKRTFTIDEFKGMDLSSSLFDIADNEAVDLDNIEYDKSIRRLASRKGYEELLLGNGYDGNLNGVFKFEGKLFFHIGNKLYVGSNFNKDSQINEITLDEVTLSPLADHKSYGFLSNYGGENTLFILDGSHFSYLIKLQNGNYSLSHVANGTSTTIPTTTANIPCAELELSSSGSPLDDVNLLSSFRRNTFIAPTRDELRSMIIERQKITGSYLADFDLHFTLDSMPDSIESIRIYITDINGNETLYIVADRTTHTGNEGSGYAIQKSSDSSVEIGYFIWDINEKKAVMCFEAGRIDNIGSYASGTANITVEFEHYVAGNADKINKCTFGKVFNDRLFLSGNPDYPNTDWHSSGDLNDFSYFSDLDYCNYGTKETKIVGYDIYSSGVLIVVKESSNTEPTLYTRTYEEKTARDYAGNIVRDVDNNASFTEDYYKLDSINSMGGLGGLNNRSITNFLGDTVILTRDGLKALHSVQNVADNQRIFVDLSTKINAVLTKEDLKNAFIYCYNDRLYLKTPNYLFIAEYNLRDANGQYCWFKWSDIEPLYFFDYDDELYFSQGSDICKIPFSRELLVDTFTTNGHVGSVYITLSDNNEDTIITVNKNYIKELKNADTISLNVPLYNKIGSSTSIRTNESGQGSYWTPYFRTNLEFADGDKAIVGFNYQTGYAGSKQQSKEYTLHITTLDNVDYYYLTEVDSSDIIILTSVQSLSFYQKIDELEPLYFELIEGSENEFKIIERVDIINGVETNIYYRFSILDGTDITYPNNSELYISFTKNMPIKSYYYTKPINFGTTVYEKTIYSFSIVNDSKIASHMEIGYLASNKYSSYTMLKSLHEEVPTRNLFLEEFTFGKVDFLADKLPHIFNRPKKIPRIAYISFIFRNDDETSRMVISELSIIYTITKMSRGVK